MDDPAPEDLYEVGTLATILQLLKLPDGTVKVLVEGGERASSTATGRRRSFLGRDHDPQRGRPSRRARGRRAGPLDHHPVRAVRETEQEGAARDPDLAVGHRRAGRLADTVAAHMALKLSEKQRILEIQDVKTFASSRSSASSRAKSTSCRSRSASAVASSSRWRRASASTT